MKRWLRRIRGAVGIGLAWAAGWAPIGAVIGLGMGVVLGGAPHGVVVARYAALFATCGFFGGAIFSTVLRIAEGRRRFEELSLPRFAVWGALGGLLLGALATALGILGAGLDLVGAIIAGGSTLLGAGSAAGTLVLARRAEERRSLGAGARLGELGLTDEEKRELLGSA